jgi:hypothetical protein
LLILWCYSYITYALKWSKQRKKGRGDYLIDALAASLYVGFVTVEGRGAGGWAFFFLLLLLFFIIIIYYY